MQSFQEDFLNFAIEKNVLSFGEFTLKSGRVSPYFFNAGHFKTGADLSKLGSSYASAIVESGVEYDVLFGPAYKGIPLASATAVSLYREHQIDKPWCFNRKEAKDHGEGGNIVGAPLQGKVLIIDDVITAGTAIREAVDIIKAAGAEPAGVVIALDRQEKGKGERSAIQEVEQDYGIPVYAIVKLEHVYQYLVKEGMQESLIDKVAAYRSQYGISV